MEGRVDTVVYGLDSPFGGTNRVLPPEIPDLHMPRFVGGILAQESRALLEEFAQQSRDQNRVTFIKRLLEPGS
jgi:hypothetical protein